MTAATAPEKHAKEADLPLIEGVLAKLRVKPGLRGESRPLYGPWSVAFFYDRERKTFTLTLRYKNQEKIIDLRKELVETRGRSLWMADNTWRLTSAGVQEMAAGIAQAIDATEKAAAKEVGPRWRGRRRPESPAAQRERERREQYEQAKKERDEFLRGYDVELLRKRDPRDIEWIYIRPEGEFETIRSFHVGSHPYHGEIVEMIIRGTDGTLYLKQPGAFGFVYSKLTPRTVGEGQTAADYPDAAVEAGDYPDVETALTFAESRFGATHVSRQGDRVAVYSPDADGYLERVLFRTKGAVHWPARGMTVKKLPEDAEELYTEWTPEVAPRRAAEEEQEPVDWVDVVYNLGGSIHSTDQQGLPRHLRDPRKPRWGAFVTIPERTYPSGAGIPSLRVFGQGHTRNEAIRDALKELPLDVRRELGLTRLDPALARRVAEGAEPTEKVGEAVKADVKADVSFREPPSPSPEATKIPWVRVTRDPKRYEERLAQARAIGPIDNSRKIYDLLSPILAAEEQEVLLAVLCDVRLQLRGVAEVHRGSRSRTEVSIADIMRAALIEGAEAVAVVHNHPSGKAEPSKADEDLTKAISDAIEPLKPGLSFLDHVVIGMGEYYSFADGKKTKVSDGKKRK